jgi:hypothetical protein
LPKSSKTTAARSANGAGYEGHFDELGDHTVAVEQFIAGGDMASLFRGLPDDRCQTPHWGVVLKGRLTFTYADGEDVIEAGDAYYGRTHPGCRTWNRDDRVQPHRGAAQTMAVVMKNAEALGAKS